MSRIVLSGRLVSDLCPSLGCCTGFGVGADGVAAGAGVCSGGLSSHISFFGLTALVS